MEDLIVKLVEQSVMLAIMAIAWRLAENRAIGIYEDYKALSERLFKHLEDDHKASNN